MLNSSPKQHDLQPGKKKKSQSASGNAGNPSHAIESVLSPDGACCYCMLVVWVIIMENQVTVEPR